MATTLKLWNRHKNLHKIRHLIFHKVLWKVEMKTTKIGKFVKKLLKSKTVVYSDLIWLRNDILWPSWSDLRLQPSTKVLVRFQDSRTSVLVLVMTSKCYVFVKILTGLAQSSLKCTVWIWTPDLTLEEDLLFEENLPPPHLI